MRERCHNILDQANIKDNKDAICHNVFEIFKKENVDEKTLEKYLSKEMKKQNHTFDSIPGFMNAHRKLVTDFVKIYLEMIGDPFVEKKKTQSIEKIKLDIPRKDAVKGLCKATTTTLNHDIVIALLESNDRPKLEYYLEQTFKENNKKQILDHDDFFRLWNGFVGGNI